MSDFVCAEFNQIIPIKKLSLVDKFTLKIEASDLSSVKKVLVNGAAATEVLTTSSTIMYATIPESQINSVLQSVVLVGTSNEAAIISFSARSITAMNDSIYVLQRFLRILLMEKGSDAFNPTIGAGIQTAIGNIANNATTNALLAVKSAETQLIQMQTTLLDSSKTLTMVEILNISYSIYTLTLSISLSLHTLDGSKVTTNFNISGVGNG
jgi:hypothetical protein